MSFGHYNDTLVLDPTMFIIQDVVEPWVSSTWEMAVDGIVFDGHILQNTASITATYDVNSDVIVLDAINYEIWINDLIAFYHTQYDLTITIEQRVEPNTN